MSPAFLDLPGGRRLAYHLTGGALPGVVFLTGFRSDMTGSKALALEAFCKAKGQRFLRFDYTGHGQSSGDFMDCTIGGWAQDAVDMLDRVVPGPNVLVGSSLGGWIMLLAALARRDRIAGLVGIASAVDFTERLVWEPLSAAQKREMEEKGVLYLPACEGEEPYPFTRKLVEDGRRFLLLDGRIPLTAPVRLIHGSADEDVPWLHSALLLDRLASRDATLRLIKDAGHRLSQPHELAMIREALEEVGLSCA